ncbi:MAG: acetyl-CoA C-acyltransferase [Candidatus Poribacteria bacterium]|nr:acetyl-CoA C-acyltransferase [Candidatus Poribacteria bacterium]
MKTAVIVSAARTAVGKAKRGLLKNTRPDELAAVAIKGAVDRVPNLDLEEIDDVIIGCAMPEGPQGMNVGRIASLRAGLPTSVSAMTVNRFCSSGLQTIAMAAERIMCGFADVIVAGGTESMSLVSYDTTQSPNPHLVEHYPDVYLSMGLTAENLVRKYHISREDQDEFSLASHQKAIDAVDAGRFKDEIVPVTVKETLFNGDGKPETTMAVFDVDEGVRRETSMEALAKLRPVFHANGTVTAGNSSQVSDGAAAVVVMSAEKAADLGSEPLARFVSFATGGVPPEIMGIGPVAAVPKALKLAGLTLDKLDLIELNEAFAVQALSVIGELDLPREKVNVNGGAIALGHPLGCTGAKLTVTLLNEMRRRDVRYGMVTMCIGGGMGAAGIFERC